MAFVNKPTIQAEAKLLEVHAATSDLRHWIEELTSKIDLLTQRLSPVMSDINTGNDDNEIRPQSSVFLAATINAETDRVRDLTDRLSAILSRLEV